MTENVLNFRLHTRESTQDSRLIPKTRIMLRENIISTPDCSSLQEDGFNVNHNLINKRKLCGRA